MNKDQKTKTSAYGCLYIVALPIGNIEDLNHRALKILKTCDLIAAEDTRKFHLFCSQIDLQCNQVVSYHDHSEREVAPKLVDSLKNGKNIAIVSDAGTPLINDPGHHIIKLAYENNIQVKPVPGASSVTAVLSVCPIGGTTFSFIGYAPQKNDELKEWIIKHASITDKTVVFEAPHRFINHINTIKEFFKDIPIFIGREITKSYEEFLFDTPENILKKIITPKGEFVIVYPKLEDHQLSDDELCELIESLIQKNLKPKEIIESIAPRSKMNRRELYDIITQVKHSLKK